MHMHWQVNGHTLPHTQINLRQNRNRNQFKSPPNVIQELGWYQILIIRSVTAVKNAKTKTKTAREEVWFSLKLNQAHEYVEYICFVGPIRVWTPINGMRGAENETKWVRLENCMNGSREISEYGVSWVTKKTVERERSADFAEREPSGERQRQLWLPPVGYSSKIEYSRVASRLQVKVKSSQFDDHRKQSK